MERKIMSVQDWGPGGCLPIEEALRNQGISQGRRARILQCHQSQGEAQGDEWQDQMLRALGGKGWGRSLGTQKGLLDLATGK